MPIIIDTMTQQLTYTNDETGGVMCFPVSTAKNGLGEEFGSFQTPRGKHAVVAKIGAKQPLHAVFRGRRSTGEIYTEALGQQFPQRDWILTRILWLRGLEVGKNRLGNVDTMRRFIYIHGTADEHLIGQPVSHGCIRMKNGDMMALFECVSIGELVVIL